MKKNATKLLMTSLTSLLLIGGLASCTKTPSTNPTPATSGNTPISGNSGTSSDKTSTSANQGLDITLDKNYKTTISLLIPSGNENETTMIDKLIGGFNEHYPNISFKKNYVAVNSWENTVRNQNLAGSLPDIVWSNSPDFYYLVDANISEDLTPYIEASEKAGEYDFDEDFLTEYFDMGSVKGKNYLIPRSADSVVTFYNKKLLADAGIDTSTIKNGWTWNDFLEINKQYRAYLDGKGQSTYYVTDANLTTWLSTCYPILRSYGGEVLTADGKNAIDSDGTKNALNMVNKMMSDRYIVASGDTPGSSFEAGTAPFLFQSASVSLYAERRALKGNIDIVSFPLIEDNNSPKIGCGIAGYAMNKKSKEKIACWNFLSYLMSAEGQELMAQGGLNLPSIRKDLQDFTTAAWGKGYTNFNLDAYTYGSEYKISTDFFSYVDSRYKADIDQAIKDMFYNATRKDKTTDEALTKAIKDINSAIR